VKKLVASDRGAYDRFGWSVAVQGESIIVGAYAEDQDASNSNPLTDAGSAYIFGKNQGGTNNWGQVKKLVASDRAIEDYFGWSVAISGNRIAAGSYQQDQNALGINSIKDAGSAYFFEYASTLPITLANFTAKPQNNGVKLQWTTLSEQNNKEFVLSRATDGRTFTELGKLASAGNSSAPQTYSMPDRKPAMGANYYKLVQTDHDGKTTELGIRVVNFQTPLPELKVWPNPFTAGFTVWSNTAQQARITSQGGQVLLPALQLQPGNNLINTLGWPAGVYVLETTTGSIKLVKQ
jgi:hypothetical protein